MPSWIITPEEFRGLPAPVRAELLRLWGEPPPVAEPAEAPAAEPRRPAIDPALERELRRYGLTDLTVAQARQVLWRHLSQRTRDGFRFLAYYPSPVVPFEEAAAALPTDQDGGLRSIWSAMARRVRSVLNDRRASVIRIPGATRAEWRVLISPVTQAALRAAFAEQDAAGDPPPARGPRGRS